MPFSKKNQFGKWDWGLGTNSGFIRKPHTFDFDPKKVDTQKPHTFSVIIYNKIPQTQSGYNRSLFLVLTNGLDKIRL